MVSTYIKSDEPHLSVKQHSNIIKTDNNNNKWPQQYWKQRQSIIIYYWQFYKQHIAHNSGICTLRKNRRQAKKTQHDEMACKHHWKNVSISLWPFVSIKIKREAKKKNTYKYETKQKTFVPHRISHRYWRKRMPSSTSEWNDNSAGILLYNSIFFLSRRCRCRNSVLFSYNKCICTRTERKKEKTVHLIRLQK